MCMWMDGWVSFFVGASAYVCICICTPQPTPPNTKQLLAIEARNGRLLWTYEAVGPITTKPAVVPPSGAMVLVTTANGLLTAIRALPAGHMR